MIEHGCLLVWLLGVGVVMAGAEATGEEASKSTDPGERPYCTIPTVDLADDTQRQVVVDRESGQYLGHPTTVLLDDHKTILCVYPKGHARGAIVLKWSPDGGLTWSERLPVPENWATSLCCPTIYRVEDAKGVKRLIVFSGLHPIRMAVSEDDGQTWSPLKPIGDFSGIVSMASLVLLKNGDYMALFHDEGQFLREGGKEQDPPVFRVYKTVSHDGGLTWGQPEAIATHPKAHLCEPGAVRSPDGKQIAVLLRENSRKFNSFVIFSNDEGKTWSQPRELPSALTGDRHVAKYAPDGRLFMSFRDMTRESPTKGDWVGWVGKYEDIVQNSEGQYRIRLMRNHTYPGRPSSDCAYPGVEVLPDGTFVATTYGHWVQGEEPFIVSVRFTLAEVDERAARTIPEKTVDRRPEDRGSPADIVGDFTLWDVKVPLPSPGSLQYPGQAVDIVVHRADEDYQFLHDNAVIWHKQILCAAWYNCPKGEMQGSACIRGRRSLDGGKSWSDVEVIAEDQRREGTFYVPVTFLSCDGQLLAFVWNMVGADLVTQCEVFALDESRNQWSSRGYVAGPFLPNCPPLLMADGNFIMAGRMASKPASTPETPAVAISSGKDVTGLWDLVPMTSGSSRPYTAFPESTVWRDGPCVTAVVRGGLIFTSNNFGQTWRGPFRHNLPAEDSKPFALQLSTGERCLLWNYPESPGSRRQLLALAVGRPGERTLSAMWKIRHGYLDSFQVGPEWSYPCATEHAGSLYVVYTSEKKHSVMTIIPLDAISLERAPVPLDVPQLEPTITIPTLDISGETRRHVIAPAVQKRSIRGTWIRS